MRTNCLFWAWRKWRRDGGYIAMRKSRWGRFPHFLWTPTISDEALSFVPTKPRRRWFPPPFFRGRVHRGP